MIKVNLENTPLPSLKELITAEKIMVLDQKIRAHQESETDFLGWVTWPETYDRSEYQQMVLSAQKLQTEIEILLVIGIGGSYLGTRAADEMINGLYPTQGVRLIYVGNTISSTYIAQLQTYLQNQRFGICVVSKSGTTLEPALAMRIFEQQLIAQVGFAKAQELIVVITDQKKGALKALADKKNYQTFKIPQNIGGRFSVLTPVGLYPLLVAGIDTDAIFQGAQQAYQDLQKNDLSNPAYQYAVARYELYKNYHYRVETLVTYELQMQYFNEWWKQLFGESEGKLGKGLLPTAMIFSTDLHSLGQWVQEGQKGLLFETILHFQVPTRDLFLPSDADNFDQLNYLSGKSLDEINQIAMRGVLVAHAQTAQIPNLILEISEPMGAKTFGYLVYFFELTVAMSGFLLEVNPFDQPGVEIYKKNMFHLLEKPEN